MSDGNNSIIHKSLKVEIFPTDSQYEILANTFGCCRKVYNIRLDDHIQYYEKYKDIPKEDRPKFESRTPKQLREANKELEFLGSKLVIQEALSQSQRNCEQAYSNFFASVSKQRKGKPVGYPKFKSKKLHRDSFSLFMIRDEGLINFSDRTIFIPKLKETKFRIANSSFKSKWINWFMNAKPLSMTISRIPCGKIFCSILFEGEINSLQRINLGNSIGLDFSPSDLYITDKNESAKKDYRYTPKKQSESKKLAKLQQSLARKKKGSNNYEKARIKLAREEKHISDSRRDYIEKETLRLVRNYDVIGIEDLNLLGMMQFSRNAKNYVDTSWCTFVEKLKWKSQFNNCIVVQSDRYYPSSKTCNHCGYINKELTLKDRTWVCPQCGTEIIRDANAGQNLKDNALRIIVEDLVATLGMERTDVMSVENIEVVYSNKVPTEMYCKAENLVCEN